VRSRCGARQLPDDDDNACADHDDTCADNDDACAGHDHACADKRRAGFEYKSRVPADQKPPLNYRDK
jgi:hypothetical protein